MKIQAGPAFSIPVSDEEKEQARIVRRMFEDVLRKQDSLLDYLEVFFSQLDELKQTTGLVTISPLLKRYEHKLKKIFGIYIGSLSKALATYEKSFSDSQLNEIRDLIIENVRNMRQEVIDLIVLFKNVSSPEFVKDSKEIYEKIQNNSEQVENIIRNEWFSHIDYNILGKIKLGHNIPLSIK